MTAQAAATPIVITKPDEAPFLALAALLSVLKPYLAFSNIPIEVKDISLATRILATFPEYLTEEQKVPNALGELAELVQSPDANIVKLPNISASVTQLKEAIRELQEQGYNIPDYPEQSTSGTDKKIKDLYDTKVVGSVVNPVIREGNSDRRLPQPVKKHAKKNPHKGMKPWPEHSNCRVAHMSMDDFYDTEKSLTITDACKIDIEFVAANGSVTQLKNNLQLLPGEIVDSSVMKVAELRRFFGEEMDRCKKEEALFSLHVKATMMKKSDPEIFGHCVSVYYENVLEKHAQDLQKIGVDPNNGLGDLLAKIESLPEEKRSKIKEDIKAADNLRPGLAMVDSDKGITNFHAPNLMIIDASMPNVIKDGGKMWNRYGMLQDAVAVIPDRTYATIYKAVVDDCIENGQFNPETMGSVSNVGLMAQKAEEYGSHDKTFKAQGNGHIRVISESGEELFSQEVEAGDIFRMCQTKNDPVKNWVELAVARAKEENCPAVFWLDENRAHDKEVIKKVAQYLSKLDTDGLEISIMKPEQAMKYSLERIREGHNTISVTGNVLRDYLTDLFPILEIGTSAKMLSNVPLMNGGGLFETGAGGSAPKHVEQFLQEGYLRWDSLGEYTALVTALNHHASKTGNNKATIFANALDKAIGEYLENEKSPTRKLGGIDNRGSTFYIGMYWAKALSEQVEDKRLQESFKKLYQSLSSNEDTIIRELLGAQGSPVDIGGYYHPDKDKVDRAMNPSATLSCILSAIS